MICPLYQFGEIVIDLSKLVSVSCEFSIVFCRFGGSDYQRDFSMEVIDDSAKAQTKAEQACADLLTHWYAIKIQEHERCNSSSSKSSATAE